MMYRACLLRLWFILIIVGLFSACATKQIKQVTDTVSKTDLQSWQQRLVSSTQWQFSGRMTVSNGDESSSGRIFWKQNGAAYHIEIRAPISGQTWRLYGDKQGAWLEGIAKQPIFGEDPQELLWRKTGWFLPVHAAQSWVLGFAQDWHNAKITWDMQHRPERIEEAGWLIQYAEWMESSTHVILPKRIIAKQNERQVRLAIKQWE